MSTGTPVVISRIQNRRGLQADFDALYPAGQPGSGPDVLQPGEIALCTDTGNVYIGTIDSNISGYYIKIAPVSSGGPVEFLPSVSVLAPTSTWTQVLAPIDDTPFFTLLYSLTDIVTTDPNAVGINFSKNGELIITSTDTDATLADIGTEINTTLYDINFTVTKSGTTIELLYIHNFPTPITFSTGSIIWAPI